MAQMEPLPGTADIWEPEVSQWVTLEQKARRVFRCYGYGELRTPIMERTDLFIRGIGDATDVVQKEMYSFVDRGGRSLTLRPEGTAGVMRAIANVGLAQGEEQRVYYLGPMFRGERPAAGRRRQFHQVGVEAVGRATPGMDVECMAMLMHYLAEIGLGDGTLLLNTRGTQADHEPICNALQAHFRPLIAGMCEDCQRRLESNVWRILDCKNEPCQLAISEAPAITELLGPASRQFFAQVCRGLEQLGIAFEVAPRLVRGLDYYEHTIFEVVHGGLGAQNALAGGGRYRINLAGQKKPVEGVGFAAGMERLLMARESLGIASDVGAAAPVEVYVAAMGENCQFPALALAQRLRSAGIAVLAEVELRSMKAQMRTANKLNVPLVVVVGEEELARGSVQIKDMTSGEQRDCSLAEVVETILSIMKG